MEPTDKKEPKRRHDEAFKKAAVELMVNSGKSPKEIAQELGVSIWNLRDWKNRYLPAPPGPGPDLGLGGGGEPRVTRGVATGQKPAGHIKKNFGYNLRTAGQRFARVKTLAMEYTVFDLCESLEVSRSGYYAWAGRKPGVRARGNEQLGGEIKVLFQKSRESYGSPRITVALRQTGRGCNHKRVERLMREHGLQGRQRRRYRVLTTDSQHDQPIAPNRLAETAPCTAPDQVWVTDITYVPTQEGWLYVAGVLDLYSRKVVGWAMGETLVTALPLAALEMACHQRRPAPGLLHHSDRGVQYASQSYRDRLRALGLEASMSRKANCYDNATMESFWSTLKHELVYRVPFANRAQARQRLFEWIEVFYNRTRLHSRVDSRQNVTEGWSH